MKNKNWFNAGLTFMSWLVGSNVKSVAGKFRWELEKEKVDSKQINKETPNEISTKISAECTQGL